MCPLYQSEWLRMVEPSHENEAGQLETNGCWRCAIKYAPATATTDWKGGACLQKWGDGDGQGRVLVLKHDADEFQDDRLYTVFLLGPDTNQKDYFIVTLLKCATLLDQTKGKTDTSSLLEGLVALNEECSNKLGSLAICRTVRTCNLEDTQHIHYRPYCENKLLSICEGGR